MSNINAQNSIPGNQRFISQFSIANIFSVIEDRKKRGQARISPKAVRLEDGSIQATCSGTEQRVGTLFNTSKGRVIEGNWGQSRISLSQIGL